MSRLKKINPPPLIAPMTTKLEWAGTSADGRTNRWKLTCPNCGQQQYPRTTLMNENTHNCTSCARLLLCDYRAGVETARICG